MLIRGSGAQTKATASRVLLILDGNVLAGQFPESRADAVRDCGRPRLDVCEYLIRDPIPYGFESRRTLLDRAGALSAMSRLVESLRDSLIEAEIPEEGQVSPRLPLRASGAQVGKVEGSRITAMASGGGRLSSRGSSGVLRRRGDDEKSWRGT